MSSTGGRAGTKSANTRKAPLKNFSSCQQNAHSVAEDGFHTYGDADRAPCLPMRRIRTPSVRICSSLLAANTSIMIDPDKTFSRHTTVLGNTGSGNALQSGRRSKSIVIMEMRSGRNRWRQGRMHKNQYSIWKQSL